MKYAFNLKTRELAPLATGDKIDPEEFLSKDSIVVDEKQAKLLTSVPREARGSIIHDILTQRYIDGQPIPDGAEEVYRQGLRERMREQARLEQQAKANAKAVAETEEVAKTAPTTEAFNPENYPIPDDEGVAINISVENDESKAYWSKQKIAKQGQPKLVDYARNILKLEVADNMKADELKALIIATQFGEEKQ